MNHKDFFMAKKPHGQESKQLPNYESILQPCACNDKMQIKYKIYVLFL